MRNYVRENSARYRKMQRMGIGAWAEWAYGGTDYADFSSRRFLDDVIPRLCLDHGRRRTLELGTGVGPGAIYLAERGFQVHGIDLIPEAIEQARRIASERGLQVGFEVMDVTRIPHHGPGYDLIVDSYCLQGIVLDEDREAVFRAIKARLNRHGYYLLSSAMYAPARHRSGQQVIDRGTGRLFDRYDRTCHVGAAAAVAVAISSRSVPQRASVSSDGARASRWLRVATYPRPRRYQVRLTQSVSGPTPARRCARSDHPRIPDQYLSPWRAPRSIYRWWAEDALSLSGMR